MQSLYPTTCIYDQCLEVRDGYNKSANLLGEFCGWNISVFVRSSGQNLWIRKSVHFRHLSWYWGSYTNKTLNFTGIASEITYWNNSKMFVSCRNTEGIDGNHEYSNSFGNFIYLFSSSWTQPRQGGRNSICSFQPNFIPLVSSPRCTSTIYSLEKERKSGTEQYKCKISADHYWRKQWRVQLWSEQTGCSWQERNQFCHWKWVLSQPNQGGKFFKETVAPRWWGVLQDYLVLFFAERNISPWRRGNPLNFSFRSSLRLQIFIVNSADKTKLLSYKQLILKSVRRRGKYTTHLQSLPNRK